MTRRRPLTVEEHAASLGAGLSELEAMRVVTSRGVGDAPLPPLYTAAVDALRACLRAPDAAFPARYDVARAALAACAATDECAAWPRPSALASYARQSDDETLERLARRVNARRAAEVRL